MKLGFPKTMGRNMKIIVNHGGKLQREKEAWCYLKGKKLVIEDVDPDLLFLYDLIKMIANNGGYINVICMHYVGETNQLKKLNSNEDVVSMIRECSPNMEAHIYIEHGEEVEENKENPYEEDVPSVDEKPSAENADEEEPSLQDNLVRDALEDESRYANATEKPYEMFHDIGSDVSDEELVEIKRKKEKNEPLIKMIAVDPMRWNNKVFVDDESDVDPSDIETDVDDDIFQGEAPKRIEKRKYRKFKWPDHDALIHFELGMEFDNKKHLKEALDRYSIAQRFDLKNIRDDGSRLNVVCINTEECPWRLYASWNQKRSKFQVKTLIDNHECGKSYRNRRITADWLAKQYFDRFKQQPGFRLVHFKQDVFKNFEANVTFNMCARARQLALDNLHGSMVKHYAKLWSYKAELERRNEGITVDLQGIVQRKDGPIYFNRIYICFDNLREGFLQGCRPVLHIDGCFLKGMMKGELLTAVGRDANNQMYPVAWAVVQVENKDNWMWFLNHLIEDLDMLDGDGWCLVTDQMKGLIPAIGQLLPKAEHRMCARHIYANWSKNHKGGDLRLLFWKIAKSCNIDEMDRNMKELEMIDRDAHDDLWEAEPLHWCRAYFEDFAKVDNVDNNMAEAFNWTILEFRFKPLIYMLEDIRNYMMDRLKQRRDWMAKQEVVFCPRVMKKIEKYKKEVRNWYPQCNGDDRFQVKNKLSTYIVDLRAKTCTCRRWQLQGIPCTHALCAMLHMGKKIENYIDPYYSKDYFMKAYSSMMPPMGGENQWPLSEDPPLMPPPIRRMPGAPKRNRRKDPAERVNKQKEVSTGKLDQCGRKISCRVCGGEGHNKRSCPSAPKDYTAGDISVKSKTKKARKDGNENVEETSGSAAKVPSTGGCRKPYVKYRNKGGKRKETNESGGDKGTCEDTRSRPNPSIMVHPTREMRALQDEAPFTSS